MHHGPKHRGPMMGGPMMDPRSRFFMALANDQRLKILLLLKGGPKNTADILNALQLDPSVVSRHLTLLRNVGLIHAHKEGVALSYTIADERIFEVIRLASAIIKDWLDKHLEFFDEL